MSGRLFAMRFIWAQIHDPLYIALTLATLALYDGVVS